MIKQKVIAFVEVVVVTKSRKSLSGYVLRVFGDLVQAELDYWGPDLGEWAISDVPDVSGCVMVWEGVCGKIAWIPVFYGAWRRATPEELIELGSVT